MILFFYLLCILIVNAVPTPQSPTLSPTPGTYDTSVQVLIISNYPEVSLFIETSSLPGAIRSYNSVIGFFQFDVENPGNAMEQTRRICGYAQIAGYDLSAPTCGNYTVRLNIDANPPLILPSQSSFTESASIEIQSTSTSLFRKTYYLLDESGPVTESSNLYSSPITVVGYGTHTIRAVEVSSPSAIFYNISSETVKTFTISPVDPLAPPTVNNPSDIYVPSVSLIISCSDENAFPFYNINNGPEYPYGSPILFTVNPVSDNEFDRIYMEVKSRCRKTGQVDSLDSVWNYVIQSHFIPHPPVISPSTKFHSGNSLEVSVSCFTDCNGQERMFVTTDSSSPSVTFSPPSVNPSNTSTVAYNAPIVLEPGIHVVKAISVKNNWYSQTVYQVYEIEGVLSPPEFSPPNQTVFFTSEATVFVSSNEAANVWFIVREENDFSPIPPLSLNSEWQKGDNITLSSNAIVHIAIDKLYYRNEPQIFSSIYHFETVPPQLDIGTVSYDLWWLLLLLLIVPIALAIVGGILYYRKKKREEEEAEVFKVYGFTEFGM